MVNSLHNTCDTTHQKTSLKIQKKTEKKEKERCTHAVVLYYSKRVVKKLGKAVCIYEKGG